MKIRDLIVAMVVSLMMLAASGCGAARVDSATPGTGHRPASVLTTLYFLTADRSAAFGVRRAIPSNSPHALGALRALLAGPNADEKQRGIKTALPGNAEVLSLRIENNTTAVVNLSNLPANADGVERVRIITQITRSVVGLSGIERIRLRTDGQPWGLWKMAGGAADDAYGYDSLLGLTQVCAAKPGTEAVVGDCFSALP